MSIPILIVLLVFALAVGPIFWFRSTPGQRRVVQCRNRAARLGLRVRLVAATDLGVPGKDGELVGYGLPWVGSEQEPGEEDRRVARWPWRLVRQRIDHDSHFAGWWDWSKGLEADRGWHEPVKRLIPDLPADAVAVESTREGLWIYWNERGGTDWVDRIDASLRRLRQDGGELG